MTTDVVVWRRNNTRLDTWLVLQDRPSNHGARELRFYGYARYGYSRNTEELSLSGIAGDVQDASAKNDLTGCKSLAATKKSSGRALI